MTDFYNLFIGLLLAMLANIIFGLTLAKLKQDFKSGIMWNGIFKAIMIVLGISAMYLCSYINPSILVANINGMNVNLIDGMKTLFVVGIGYYGVLDLTKLGALLKVSTSVLPVKEEETIQVPIDNNIRGSV